MTDNKTALLIAALDAAYLANIRAEKMKDKFVEVIPNTIQIFLGSCGHQDGARGIEILRRLVNENAVETANDADGLKGLVEKALKEEDKEDKANYDLESQSEPDF